MSRLVGLIDFGEVVGKAAILGEPFQGSDKVFPFSRSEVADRGKLGHGFFIFGEDECFGTVADTFQVLAQMTNCVGGTDGCAHA